MEKMGVKVIGFFNRLGLMKSLKPMSTDALAKKMLDDVRYHDKRSRNVQIK
jgi:hypothetical protein